MKRQSNIFNFISHKNLISLFIAIFILVTTAITFLTLNKIKQQQIQLIENELKVILYTTSSAMELWIEDVLGEVAYIASDSIVISMTEDLLKLQNDKNKILRNRLLKDYRRYMEKIEVLHTNNDFYIIDYNSLIIASLSDCCLGLKNPITAQRPKLLEKVFQGESQFIPPISYNFEGEERTITLFYAVPIKNNSGNVIAVLAVKDDPQEVLTKFCHVGYSGRSEEIYAIDQQGRMISNSRFDDQLKKIGLLKENQSSLLNIYVKNPGSNLLKGYKPNTKIEQRPLTMMAQYATKKISELNIQKYPDYRGVDVFGVWQWNENLNFGMASEIDVKDALSSYFLTRLIIIIILIIVSTMAILLTFTTIFIVNIANHELKKSAARYQDLISASNTGAWEYNRDAKYLWCSKEYFSMLGRDEKDFDLSGKPNLAETWINLLHPDDKAEAVQCLSDYLDQGSVGMYESHFRMLHKSGEWIWILSRGKTILDENDNPINLTVGTIIDVTQQKVTEKKLKKLNDELEFRVNERTAAIEANERELKKQSKLLHNTIDSLSYPFYVIDVKDYSVLIANEAARSLTDNPNATHCYALTHGLSSPCKSKDHPCPMQEVLRTKKPTFAEHDHSTEFGEIFYVEVHGYPVFDENGELVQMIEYHLDITERKLDETEIIENKNRTDAILRASINGIISINEAGMIETFNPAAQKMFGYDGEEIIGKSINTLMPAKHAKHHDDYLRNYLTSGNKKVIDKQVEVMGKRKNGELFPMEIGITEVNLQNARLFTAAINDITERKKGETELRKSEHQIRTILETAYEGFWYVDNSRITIHVNPAMCVILARTENEIEGYDIFDFVDEENRKIFEEQLELRKQGVMSAYDIALKRPDGSLVSCLFNATPLLDENGQKIGSFAMVTDITDRKRMEEDLLLAKVQAEEATKAKSDFLANMSHEIRTPMNAVLGLNHLLQKTEMTNKQRDYTKKIERSAQNLLGIINDILDFSKIEAGKIDMEFIDFNLDEVLENLSSLMNVKAQEKELELIVHRNPDVPINLVGDSLRLGQILINLSTNAIKFTETGEVEVKIEMLSTNTKKAHLKFSVRDTGIGLTEVQIDNLFQEFHQADTSTTRKYGGTGLGLTISKKLVKMMNGEIGVDSKYGSGSIFYFTGEFGISKKKKIQQKLTPNRLKNLKVLIVDDNETVLEIHKGYCEDFGFRVATARNETEVFNELKKSHIDLILMDLKLPAMDGIEITRLILSDPYIPQKPRIIMITAYGRESVLQQAETIGIDGFLIKPVNQSLLFDTIVEIFGESSNSEESLQKPHTKTASLEKIRGAHLLLVEDNEINQQVAVELLESEGFMVEVAGNGKKAIEIINTSQKPFDLVFMDLQMPVMDGYTATEILRKNDKWQSLPILAMTADAMSGVQKKVLAAGMNDYVTKPIDIDELYSVMVKWVNPDNVRHSKNKKTNKSTIFQKDIKIPTIPSLNVEEALKRVAGNQKLFMKILNQFAVTNANFQNDILDKIKANDPETALRIVHTLKGVSGSIGATNLHEAVKEFEIFLKNNLNDIETIKISIYPITEMIKIIISEIEKSQENLAPQKSSQEKGIFDIIAMKPLFASLRTELEQYSSKSLDVYEELNEIYCKNGFTNVLERLGKQISAYKFDEALNELKKIENNI